jgi:hypothetical protein
MLRTEPDRRSRTEMVRSGQMGSISIWQQRVSAMRVSRELLMLNSQCLT